MSEREYHPCRYCTDKPVCKGECAKAAPYINRDRRTFREEQTRRKEKK